MKKKELKRLILKYETMLDTLIVMDDYDGGEANMLRTILKDLKEIEATASLDEHIQKVRTEAKCDACCHRRYQSLCDLR